MSMYRRRLLASASLTIGAFVSAVLPMTADANPTGGQVVAGVATITATSSQVLTINQQTSKAVIDWRSFSIASGETTQFNQPSASSISLNRVTGGDPSQILGNLTSNGQVWLVNPNGVVFGKSARVDVAGLLATTLDITNQDFLAGNYRFSATGAAPATIVNAGTITIQNAGLAALVAPGVENSGVIAARLGRIQLTSADGFTVDFYGDGTFNFLLSQAVSNSLASGAPVGVTNSGSLIADGGQILLTAQAAKSVVDQSINMTGYIEARTVGTQGGVITLDGGTGGTVAVTGTMDASGKSAGQTGGAVSVTGQSVNLGSAAMIDASGDVGGGSVRIGGDLHGAGPLQNATTTDVAEGASIQVDALANGNGGRVVIWSNDRAAFGGAISARGGAVSGNGGSVEVSGHRLLDFTGTVDLRALTGSTGVLLLDPENVTIADVGSSPTVPGSPASPLTFNPTADSSVLAVSTLQQALQLANVVVTTGSTGAQFGDITVANNVSWASGNSLTLSANRNIAVNANITNTGGAGVSLRADNTGTGTGTVTFGGGAKISTSGAISIFYNPTVNLAGSVVNATSYASPTENYSGDIAGGGTLTAYMLVNSAADLQNIQNNLSGVFALGKDIDATGASFSPIGDNSNRFTGTLDGQGQTVQHLTINSAATRVGLFGYIGAAGVVRNINVTNLSVTGTFTSGTLPYNPIVHQAYTDGGQFIGGLAGQNDGTITNTSIAGSVAASSWGLIGGLVGWNQGIISQSFTLGSVSASPTILRASEVGGLVADNEGSIADSYSRASVSGGLASGIGGLVGGFSGLPATNPVQAQSSYAAGPVTATSGQTGGLVGAGSPTITNSYWDTQVTGQAVSAGGTPQTTAQLKAGLPIGFDAGVWAIDPAVNGGYPYLKWQVAVSSGGTAVNFAMPVVPPPPLRLSQGQSTGATQNTRASIDRTSPARPKPDLSIYEPGAGIDLWSSGQIEPWQAAGAALTYAKLSDAIYSDRYMVDGWTRVATWQELVDRVYSKVATPAQLAALKSRISATGFDAAIYEKDGHAVLVFRGTDGLFALNDWATNIEQFLGIRVGNQYEFASTLGLFASSIYPHLITTGHSLGGGLAQYVAWKVPSTRAVVFNAAGIGGFAALIPDKLSNVVDFNLDGDIVSARSKQLGTVTYHLPNTTGTTDLIYNIGGGYIYYSHGGSGAANIVSALTITWVDGVMQHLQIQH